MKLWTEWQVCQKMRCTLTELKQQPMAEMEIVMAFVQGENDGQKELHDSQ